MDGSSVRKRLVPIHFDNKRESITLYLIVMYDICLYGIHLVRFCIFRKKTFFHMLSILKIVLDIYYLYIYNYTIFKGFVKCLETYIHN